MTTASAPAPLIIHIGLAKTATTVLQRHVFRTLAAEAGLSYLGSRALAEFIDAREAGRPVPAHQPRPGGELISSESLAGWNPNRWLANLAANRDHFGPEATVLLVIRQPKTWLRSLYQQLCQHEGEWIHPHEFFLAACPHDPGNLRPRFDDELALPSTMRMFSLAASAPLPLAAQELDPLTVAGDPGYHAAIAGQPNIPRPILDLLQP